MPIKFDEYDPDSGDGLRLTGGSNAHRVLQFLANQPEQGFTPKEISEETEVPRGSVGTTLVRLEKRDLVRHKKPYWAIGDDDRLAAYESMLHGVEAAGDRFGDESWGEWQETAVDPRTEKK